ncbi:MAG: type II secretion system protein GspD, partial [Rhodocyclaceae bacterium]
LRLMLAVVSQGGFGGGAAPAATAGAAGASPVVVNPEAGLVMIYATERQHRRVRDYLARVQANARRQVLIEATVVEVALDERSESGIDWRRLATGAGFTMRTDFMGLNLDDFSGGTSPFASNNPRGIIFGYGNARNYALAMKLLAEYGRVKVLSSPKVSTLNNQPALLRVVDNIVFFTVGVQPGQSSGGVITPPTYTTTPNTVAIGFTMSVTPQIDATGVVTLYVRPTITRLQGYARDPNPQLTTVANLVPIVQTREIDSVMKLPSGAIAMMGGLMEDTETRQREGVPGLSALDGLGALFGVRNSGVKKTELVIFLRPVVIADTGLDGDYAHVKELLPDGQFFAEPWLRPPGGRQ